MSKSHDEYILESIDKLYRLSLHIEDKLLAKRFENIETIVDMIKAKREELIGIYGEEQAQKSLKS